MRALSEERFPAEPTVKLTGEFDINRRDELAALLRQAEDARVAILDLTGTTYMEATSLGCLLRLRNRRRAKGLDGIIRLVGVCPNIRKLFTIVGLDKTFAFLDDPMRRPAEAS